MVVLGLGFVGFGLMLGVLGFAVCLHVLVVLFCGCDLCVYV